MKIGIGTAQFGLDYGISNRIGQTSFGEAKKIVAHSLREGITTFDTAPSYGNSEEILGSCLKNISIAKIITKTPLVNVKKSGNCVSQIFNNAMQNSLERLKRKKIYGLLLHNSEDLISNNGDKYWSALLKLKEFGLVDKLGVSVYSPSEVRKILYYYDIDMVQLPLNVLDQRMINSGILQDLKKRNIEIHSRSIFLQGLLLMNPLEVDGYFKKIKEKLGEYHTALRNAELSKVQGALGFISQVKEIDVALIGFNCLKQLEEITSNIKNIEGCEKIHYSDFSVDDIKIINPSKWQIKDN